MKDFEVIEDLDDEELNKEFEKEIEELSNDICKILIVILSIAALITIVTLVSRWIG